MAKPSWLSRALGGVLVWAAAPPVAAEPPQWWNHISLQLVQRPDWNLTAVGVLRIRDLGRDPYDRRAGVVLSRRLPRGLALSAGYLGRRVLDPGGTARTEHRLLGGPLWQTGAGRLRTRLEVQFERQFFLAGLPDRTRFRPRWDVELRRSRLSPYVFQEGTFLTTGFVRFRGRLGGRWRFPSGDTLETAYQFESLLTEAAWRPRHAIHLAYSFRLFLPEP
jgi:hypothetical protein